MNTELWLMLYGGLFVAIIIVSIIVGIKNGLPAGIASFMFVGVFWVYAFGIFIEAANDEVKRAKVNDVLSFGYTVYLDGVEVDSDKLDINLYEYTISDEKESVYLTRD